MSNNSKSKSLPVQIQLFLQGKSKSQGGLNVSDVKKLLEGRGISVKNKSKQEIITLLKNHYSKSHTNKPKTQKKKSLIGLIANSDDIKCARGSTTSFNPIESKFLSKFHDLYKTWGYRQGKNGNHINYELKSHSKDLVLIQQYTDLLMRLLQQNGDYGMGLIPSDVVKKISYTQPPSVFDKHSENIQLFLQSYLKLGNNYRLMKSLALTRITKSSTIAFSVIITSARVFLLIAKGKFDEANNLYDKLNKIYTKT